MVATLNSGQYLSCPNLEWNGLNDDELAFHSKLYSVYFLLGVHYFTAKEKYHHIDQNRNFDKHILKGEHCWQVDNSFFGKICPVEVLPLCPDSGLSKAETAFYTLVRILFYAIGP